MKIYIVSQGHPCRHCRALVAMGRRILYVRYVEKGSYKARRASFIIQERLGVGAGIRFALTVIKFLIILICVHVFLQTGPNWFAFIHQSCYNGINDVKKEYCMTLGQIKKRLQSGEYDFLRTDEHLGRHIILLTLGGSHAYGTSMETKIWIFADVP